MKNILLFILLYITTLVSSDGELMKIRQSKLIIGGQDTTIRNAPYQVSLRNKKLHHLCGGAIIDTRWIVTAAHCMTSGRIVCAIAGTDFISSGGIRYNVSRAVIHPWYDSKNNRNDVCLIKTKNQIVYNELIQPIALPTRNIPEFSVLTATGWGLRVFPGNATEVLQTLRMNTMTNSECTKASAPEKIFYTNVCTFIKGRGLCYGDSGGPLVDDNKQLQAIVSWGDEMCNKAYPDVSTRMYYYRMWILSIKLIYRWIN